MAVLNHTTRFLKNNNTISHSASFARYNLTMLVKNKKGALTKISTMLSAFTN